MLSSPRGASWSDVLPSINQVLSSKTQPKIHEYGAIGDCRALALVSSYGSIDWLCWPRFDSPAIFAAILDRERGGHWSITPSQPSEVQRAYVPSSNVLETCFISGRGRATLTDLMPVTSETEKRGSLVPDHELIRRLECTDGEIEIETSFYPRPDYGRTSARLKDLGPLGLKMEVGRGAYWLRSNVPMVAAGDHAHLRTTVRRGEQLQFSLSYSEEAPAVLPLLGAELEAKVQRSIDWWQRWASRCTYDGPYRDAVVRSALALKLLTYAPSGAIIAAPTTSLPELVGESLNWDYRFCWLRDASLTVRALLGVGYVEETESFLTWLIHATNLTQPKLHSLYSVFGEIAPQERTLPHLRGYLGSRPVRIGNAAAQQTQLDVYGEVIDAAARFILQGGTLSGATQRVVLNFGRFVARHWDSSDEGIWEPRSGPAHHTHSRLLCWAALDRLLDLGTKGLLPNVPRREFEGERRRIEEQVRSRAWNPVMQSYVSTLDGDQLDANLLLIPWYGFEAANSSRMISTYARVTETLGAGPGLIYRYLRQPHEGAFLVCSFWAAEYLALGGGTLEEAQRCFEQVLKHQNDLGLFAEETSPDSGDALGNFPQGFTHIGLIGAALALQEREAFERNPGKVESNRQMEAH